MNLFRRLRRPAIDTEGVLAVVYSYYLDPQPQRALAAFEALVERGLADDPAQYAEMASAAWVFGRIAGRNPEIQGPVRRALERRRATDSLWGRMVLETAQRGEEASRDLLTRPLTASSDIAFLGAEAVVTGSLEPFIRMIDALEAPDVTRFELEQWLRGETPATADQWIDEGIEILAADYHIVARADPPAVLTVSDCDLMVMIRKPVSIDVTRQGQPTFNATFEGEPLPDRRPLPIELNARHAEPLRIKVSAALDLLRALNEHEGLVDRMRSEVSRRDDPRVRIGLLELLAGYELPKFRTAEGIRLLERVLEVDPYRDDLERLIERLRRNPFPGPLAG